MYKGNIPFSTDGKPLYFPREEYVWEYNGIRYLYWFEVEKLFGKDALKATERIQVGPIWKPNEVFEASMSIESYSRGRSAANFDLKDIQTGITYTMFMIDVLDLIKKHTLDRGETPKLKWQFTKRGQNYGIQLAE